VAPGRRRILAGLAAVAVFLSACATGPPATPLDIGNLASYPPLASPTAEAPTAEAPTAEASMTLTGAGDIASCERTEDESTAALLADQPGWVFTAGDNAYEDGSPAEFEECYDPSWGVERERTLPALGNHDAKTSGASGYFGYFGPRAGDPRAGWYAVDVGAWRLIVLDSNCVDGGGCDASSDQGRWLAAELADHPAECSLAIWHHPRWSTGYHGPIADVAPFWEALHAAGVELVVNGHDHDYERFAPIDPDGRPDPEGGIRQIVAGTGGAALRPFETEDPNSEVRDATTYGVLRLDLHPGAYDWEFIPVAGGGGTFTDQGSGECH